MLIFPTCIGVLGFARGASTDMVFSGTLALTLAAAAEVVLRPAAGQHPPRLWQALLGIFLGAAVLAKGPAGVVLAGGSVLLWAVLTGEWRRALRPLHPRVILWFAITALPWYVMCARLNPGFVDEFLFAHNLQRYLTPVFRHVQPWWFFGPVLLLGLLPWTALLAGAAHAVWRTRDRKRSPSLFFACWAGFPLLFFSFSQSKLPGYILPAIAPLVLLMAASIARSTDQEERTSRWLMAGVGATILVLALTAGHWLERLPHESGLAAAGRVKAWLVVAAAAGLLAVLLSLLRRPRSALIFTALFLASLTEAANRVLVPKLDPYLSPRAAAELVLDDSELAQQVQVYRLHRAWHFGLNFYLKRELPLWQPDREGTAWVFTSQEGQKEIQARGRTIFLLPSPSPEAVLVRVE
jgi:4-amino-4-deoxy-L-arabinose transferase-like glycosyltransferase